MGISASQSVARRLALRAIVLLAIVFFAMSLLIGFIVEKNAREDIERLVADKAHSMASVAEAVDAMSGQMLLHAYEGLKNYFDDTVTFSPDTGELLNRGMALNNNFAIVDRFSNDGGRIAAVFARKGDDFERITTSIKKDNSERAVGTVLDRQDPAYAAIMAGKTYTGRASFSGKPYVTHYEPLRDGDGKVAGILFAGSDIALFDQTVEQQINGVRFFETGGLYAIDPQQHLKDAVFTIHPVHKGKKVLEVYPAALPFLEQLAKSEGQLVANAPGLLNTASTDKWAMMRVSPLSHWWVVAEVSDHEAMQRHWAAMRIIWAALAIAAVLLGAGLFVMIRKTVSQPLAELTEVVTTVAGGDLTQSFDSQRQDEIGVLMRAVEAMRAQYHRILLQVREASYSVGVASGEISSGTRDLSQRTEEAASSLEETAASMEELTSIVRQSAESSQQANQLAASASTVAKSGGVIVNDVVVTMDSINESSRKIADIIGVIDGIAFQTNLLALNAAVEAARAGEQGRGFAVVASEVRSLAQRSAQAALEIKDLINDSVARVGNGAVLVKQAGTTMQEIVESVERVSAMLAEITHATAEQASGIGQVNHAVIQLDQMTQQNAALVEESSAAAETLKGQAVGLNQAIAVFKLGESSLLVMPATQPVFAQQPQIARAKAKQLAITTE